MAYEVLARKWRPQSFDEVVGQGPVVDTLKRALAGDRVAHAFLFTGSRGVGKTTLARLMAKALCCATGVTPAPCGECSHCLGIANGSAVDVVEIDGASHTGVDDIRDLRESARFQPQACRYKVFIIDEVHMLSTSAFNALLKTLEEPPPHVKFIFATTEPHKIPVTILSRCQRYDFRRIQRPDIIGRLEYVLGEEGLRVDPAGLSLIATAAEGGMRDALSLTDQVLSFAGNEATLEQVRDALGIIDRRTVVKAVDAILKKDATAALGALSEVHQQGYDLVSFAEHITDELRHLAVSKAAGGITGFCDLTDEAMADIDARAADQDAKDLRRLFQTAIDHLTALKDSANERLSCELWVIKMCARPDVMSAQAVSEALVRLDALAHRRPVPPLAPGAQGPAAQIVDDARQASRTDEKKKSAPEPVGAAAEAPAPEQKAAPTKAPREAEPTQKGAPAAEPAQKAPPTKPEQDAAALAPAAAAAPKPAEPAQKALLATPPQSAPEKPAPAKSAPAKPAQKAPKPPQKAPPPAQKAPPPAQKAPPPAQKAPPPTTPKTVPPEAKKAPSPAPQAKPSAPPPPGAAAANDDDEDDDDGLPYDDRFDLPLENVDEQWIQFVDGVARHGLRGDLSHGHFVRIEADADGPVVHAFFEKSVHHDKVKESLTDPHIVSALQVYGEGARLLVVDEPTDDMQKSIAEAQAAAILAHQAAVQTHAKNHPVVLATLALFGGEVKGVRLRPQDAP